ncbi:MAG: hypothetical protein HUU35_16465, partial [Armatimonadetes bacterium]|nr:hypothetical protein [Armatimonadota bacterium]
MLLPVLCLATALTAPLLEQRAGQVIVTGDAYRATFRPEVVGLVLDLRAADGTWLPVLGPGARVTLGTYDGQRTASLWGVRSTWSLTSLPAAVIIAQQALLEPASGQAVDLTWVATAAGLLLGWRPSGLTAGAYWFPPRLELAAGDWDGYRFWGPQGELHEGSLATLAPVPAYAGVSAWEQRGDVVPRLATELPALVLRSESRGLDLGVVLVDYQQAWAGTHSFLQRHTPNHLYLYSGHIKSELAERQRWAWLAPLPALAAAAA